MAVKIRQDDFREICEKCRNKCCYQARPPLTRSRVNRISRYLKETLGDTFHERTGRYSYPEERGDGYCVLFDSLNGLCKAQPEKPETCVAGPITFDISLKEEKIEWLEEYKTSLEKELTGVTERIQELKTGN